MDRNSLTETRSEDQATVGFYKEDVIMTATEEIVVRSDENVNYTESAEKTQVNSEEVVEAALIDKTQEAINGTLLEEDSFINGDIVVEAENTTLESANVSQYFSAEDTFNVSQDFDCTEETAWTFSKQVNSEVENISNGHHQVESEDTVMKSSLSDSVSETKIGTASQEEQIVELQVNHEGE